MAWLCLGGTALECSTSNPKTEGSNLAPGAQGETNGEKSNVMPVPSDPFNYLYISWSIG
jgi:hypothetical protein